MLTKFYGRHRRWGVAPEVGRSVAFKLYIKKYIYNIIEKQRIKQAGENKCQSTLSVYHVIKDYGRLVIISLTTKVKPTGLYYIKVVVVV